jgi:Na+/alanine symporter
MIIDIFIIIFVLISIVLSCKYKFIQFKFLKVSYKTLNHSVRNKENKHKAFLLSLGNHIGAGNIVGVCSEILIGGVGSLFLRFC